eukprot:3852086-Pyramimonas_sp.AAC.1
MFDPLLTPSQPPLSPLAGIARRSAAGTLVSCLYQMDELQARSDRRHHGYLVPQDGPAAHLGRSLLRASLDIREMSFHLGCWLEGFLYRRHHRHQLRSFPENVLRTWFSCPSLLITAICGHVQLLEGVCYAGGWHCVRSLTTVWRAKKSFLSPLLNK